MKQSFLGSERNGELMKTRIILFLSAAIFFAAPLPLCGQMYNQSTVGQSQYNYEVRINGSLVRKFKTEDEAKRYVNNNANRIKCDAKTLSGNYARKGDKSKAAIANEIAESLPDFYKKCVEIRKVSVASGNKDSMSWSQNANSTILNFLTQTGGVISDSIETALDIISDGFNSVMRYFQPTEEYDSPTQTDDGLLELLNGSPVQARVNDNSNLYAAANANSDPAVKPEVPVNVMQPSERVSANPALVVKKQSETSEQTASSAKGIVRPGIQADALYTYNEKASVDDKANSINSFYLRALSQEEQSKELGNAVVCIKSEADQLKEKAIAAVDKGKQSDYSDANSELLRFPGRKDNSGHFWNTAVKDSELRGKVLDKLVEGCTITDKNGAKKVDAQKLKRVVDYVDRQKGKPIREPDMNDEDKKAANDVLDMLQVECKNNNLCQ